MADELDRRLDAAVNEAFDEYFEDTYNSIVENRTNKQKKRAYVERNREAGHNRLRTDYISENPSFPEILLRRRFRMNNQLFVCLLMDAADAVDEYLRLGESTALSCLSNFTDSVIQLFGEEYQRRPTPEDLQRLLDIGEMRGFPGMIGSIDCMHWEWKNCPTAWKGQYTRGSGKPTLVLEAVASQDLWIWHAYLGSPGTLNDINVLDRSPVFDDIYQGRAPRVTYMVNGHQYDLAYYLTDGIYPK
uniref:DDE Tnp4 domain-containing protein n=1 Tax=Brassica oleracea var. oleracea TaxID=109376 RepID=A0A0D3BVZ2_BRAOL